MAEEEVPLRVTYDSPVNAEYVCKDKDIASKTLCFCYTSSVRQNRSSISPSKYYHVKSSRMPAMKLKESDDLLRCPILNNLKLKDGDGIIRCHELVTPQVLTKETGLYHLIFCRLSRTEYEKTESSFTFKCATVEGDDGVLGYPTTHYSFRRAPSNILTLLMNITNVLMFRLFLENPDCLNLNNVCPSYAGVVEFGTPVCISQLPSFVLWEHASASRIQHKLIPHAEKCVMDLETLLEQVEIDIEEIEELEGENDDDELQSLKNYRSRLKSVEMSVSFDGTRSKKKKIHHLIVLGDIYTGYLKNILCGTYWIGHQEPIGWVWSLMNTLV